MKFSISAIITIYNERALFESSFNEIYKFLTESFEDFEIIIIESGSTDGTADLVDHSAKQHKNVFVIHETKRNGYGAAARLGIQKATKDLVYLQPIDQCFPLSSVLEATRLMKDASCILSYRSVDPRSAYRRLQSWVFNILVRWFLGIKMRCVNSALKIYKRDTIQSLPLRETGWLIDVEIVSVMRAQGIKPREIPVPYIGRTDGQSSIRFMTAFGVFRDLLRFARTRRLKSNVAIKGEA